MTATDAVVEGGTMFGRKKLQLPSQPFVHSDTCPILRANPSFAPVWSEVERGHWRRECQCGAEDYREPERARVRLDPLDAKTSRHAPECEFASDTNPAVLRLILRVKEGMGGGYWWVECGSCSTGWQVPYSFPRC